MNWHRPGNRTKNDQIQNTKHGHKQTTWLSHTMSLDNQPYQDRVWERVKGREVYIYLRPQVIRVRIMTEVSVMTLINSHRQ